ncbi:MAG: glycoside hydrolase family 2 TIM barrel-domain containing protein [Lachnospiraceae bacterium]
MKQLYTRWGKALEQERVLQEYPRPLMERSDYDNLNGLWEYAFSEEKKKPEKYDGEILVPFSPESVLSGVKRQLKPQEYLWYRKILKAADDREGKRLLLHFGAVDQACKVYVEGKEVYRHVGGYLPFSIDITKAVKTGENELVVRVQDYSDTSYHARGKQKLKRGGMFYTAQSGIWQTVWMETVPQDYIHELIWTPLYDKKAIALQVVSKDSLAVQVHIEGEEIPVQGMSNEEFTIPLTQFHPWTPDSPYLYRVSVTMGKDRVKSYFAMRIFSVEPDQKGIPRICLNHKECFQKGVLDQGYWPDGLYTPPSDAAMIYDILQMKQMGFNMLRKHIKIEPQRWYYHCDRLGMIVWQDMVNGGSTYQHWYVTYLATAFSRLGVRVKDCYTKVLGRREKAGRLEFILEMEETVHLLYSHPSICTWVIFNEGWGQFQTKDMTALLKKLDATRLIDQASGWFDQGGGDVKSIHNYFFSLRIKAEEKRALVLSEFGGYSMRVRGHSASRNVYGYGVFHSKKRLGLAYHKMMEQVIGPKIPQGLCATVYTQLSDVEDEVNGMLTYDRAVRKI